MSLPYGPAEAMRYFTRRASSPTMVSGPADWQRFISPQSKIFTEYLAEVLEQCAVAWDAQANLVAPLSPDVGIAVDVTERMVNSMREITETRLDDVEFLYFDEP